jgi:tRNA(fMet)-specific endonuclease VapC
LTTLELLLEIVEFDQTAAAIYGLIRNESQSRGLVIGSMDMPIAAHALSLQVTLVSIMLPINQTGG